MQTDRLQAARKVVTVDGPLTKAGRKRGKDSEVIVTPPVAMADGNVAKYAELGVDRRLGEIDKLLKMAA